ncbi:5-methylcytosine-specific restriction endonuclease system specificity protein McrC [bacterium]|nr:5-methylcytosine-specific restriction endonuclease system specificity protein McrC [bacterium]
MLIDKGIFIQNIYYMLTYAFQVLKQKNYEKISGEKFDNIENLFASILSTGLAQQLKQGLYREYVAINDDLNTVRGKINLYETIKNKVKHKNMMNCDFDEYSENNIYNQIIKTTAYYLIANGNVDDTYKKKLKKIMLYFNTVDVIDKTTIQWKHIHFNKSNKNYNMLISICYFVLHDLLLSNESGNKKILQFTEEHMPRLYEKFVLEYYKKHYKGLLHVNSSQIDWNLAVDDNPEYLPKMQSDISIWDNNGNTLIIDTKYYTHTMTSSQFDKKTLHSHNLYQIFTYVKNKDVSNSGKVSGMLLYAKTNEDIVPDEKFVMGGNRIQVKTLDLNQDFQKIKEQLNDIIYNFFAVKTCI